MRHLRRPQRVCLALLLSLFPLSSPAATGEEQVWTTAQAQLHAGRSNIVSVDISHRLREQASGGDQQLARVAIDHALGNGFQLGGGIAYLDAANEKEHRLFQQIAYAKGIWFLRTRLEQRFFDTSPDPLLRLRQRVQAAFPIDAAKRLTAIVAVEGMFHLNRARPSDKVGFATLRNQFGLRYSLTRQLDAQLLYMRQQTIRDRRPDAVAHIPWLTLGWRI